MKDIGTLTCESGEHINESGEPTVELVHRGDKAILVFDYLKGIRGLQGPEGPKGDPGTSVSIQPDEEYCVELGQGYLDENGDLQVLVRLIPKTFENAGHIQGPQGEQGEQGPAGADGLMTLYRHSITIDNGGTKRYLSIVSTSSEPVSTSSLADFCTSLNRLFHYSISARTASLMSPGYIPDYIMPENVLLYLGATSYGSSIILKWGAYNSIGTLYEVDASQGFSLSSVTDTVEAIS